MGEKETVGDGAQNQTDRELVMWLEAVPLTKPAKNLPRDFSDAVLMAEILKLYYSRHVELHNYVSASSLSLKKENWNTLNRKVLAKINMRLSKETIYHLANASPGAIEKLLSELRTKVEKDAEEARKPASRENADAQMSKGESVENSLQEVRFNSSEDKSDEIDAGNEIRRSSLSRFGRLKRGILVVLGWIACAFRIWSILSYCKLPRFGRRKCDALVDVAVEQIEENETAPCVDYTKAKRELREKEEIICTLNHKIAYLESSMKFKDLRISGLTAQILQNAVEMDQTARSSDGGRAKLRSRTHNFQEAKAN